MAPDTGRAAAENYRPWLDGVRAVAIALVILEHLGIWKSMDWLLGGTGVGIFFALSGYLITGLLLKELERTKNIELKRFYIRRLARLAPALLAMLFVCNLFFWWFGAYREIFNSILAATYVTNYGTILRGRHLEGYGHTWSLAVEEHFYLVWPLLMLIMSRRFDVKRMLYATLTICLLVLVWRGVLEAVLTEQRILYVGSIERADALLYGCAGALLVRLGWRPPQALFYLGVLLIVAYLSQLVPLNALNSGVLAIGATFTLMCLDAYDSPTRKLLSAPLMVWIGVMSYGIYLWHGPLLKIAQRFGFESMNANLCVVAISVLLAAVSHKFLETPIRAYVRAREKAPALDLAPVPKPQLDAR